MSAHFLIVGAGQAAAQAVATLRQSGYEGGITLVGEETHLPYQRPPLSKKYLSGELGVERLQLRPADFYRQRDVKLERGVGVRELDLDRRQARLSDGRRIGYDALMLATGSAVRKLAIPGAELEGVHYLRTIEDADAIIADMAAHERLAIVGAGYIGLEVAAVAVKRGLAVTVLEAASRVMPRVVCPLVSDFYLSRHVDEGVRIVCGAEVARLHGARRIEAVETTDGRRFDCNMAIVGIGIRPREELARAAGLACDDGIVVDEAARTQDERVVAAGDCTRHPNALIGQSVRLESVQNAVEQAKVAALSMLGQPKPYLEVPWFWSDQYDLKLQIAGLPQRADRTVLRGDPRAGHFAVFHLADRVPVSVEAVNSPQDFLLGRKLIGAHAAVDPDMLADPQRPLTKLLSNAP